MHGKAESVRDIQFNPNSMSEFAAAFENGTIQRWDIRKPNIYERKINAHHGLTLTLDWHSDGRHIATGGRDKMIKVWDMLSDSCKPVSVIQTMAPVSKISWRPISKKSANIMETEIASCSLVSDYKIYIWDIRRPYIVSRVLDKHDNVTTGILWKDENYLWSCSKDKTFIQHDVSVADIPLDSISVIGVGWSPLGDLSVILQNRSDEMKPISIESLNLVDNDTLLKENKKHSRLYDYRHTKTLNSTSFQLFKPFHISGTITVPDPDCHRFVYLAQHYNIAISPTVSISQACENNANFALNVQKYRTHQTWKVLQYLMESEERLAKGFADIVFEPNAADKQNSRNFDDAFCKMSLKNDVNQTKAQMSDKMDTISFRNNVESILVKQKDSDKKNIFDQNKTNIFLNNIDEFCNFSHNFETISQSFNSDHSVNSFVSDFDQETQLLKYSSIENNIIIIRSHINDTNTIKNSVSPWSTKSIIHAIAEHYAERGDVQMCATVVLLMGSYIDFDPLKVEKWVGEYIELLQRYKMFITMTEVINTSSSLAIRALSQTNTSIYINCYCCHKLIINQKAINSFLYCDRCRRILDNCIICDIPVKGQYLWCQDCGHGGHADCIRNWYMDDYNSYCVCPALTCTHHCCFFAYDNKVLNE